MLIELEEKANENKTANAVSGMSGFYKNFLTKNSAIGSVLDRQIEAK